jgi:hypothetical protein
MALACPSALRVPKFQKLELTDEQRKKLDLDVPAMLRDWDNNHFTCTERVWSLKKDIAVPTYLSQRILDEPVRDVPPNFFCMYPPPEASRKLPDTKAALDFFFSHILNINSKFSALENHQRDNYIVSYKNVGTVYFPSNALHDYEQHGRCSKPNAMRHLLQSDEKLRAIDDFWGIYMKEIVKHLAGTEKVSERQRERIEDLINEHGDFILLKYAPGCGRTMHVDNLLRSDATVFTVGVGRDVVYDMARLLGRKPGEAPSILRSTNPEGTMMVLDGESRYKWAHGIPCSSQSKGGRDSVKKQTKYTLILRLLHHEELSREIGICKEIGTKMYTMTS